MKVLNVFAFAAVLSAVSVSVSAAPTAISSNALIQQPDCALLAEDVRVPLSNSVLAAYNCEGAGIAIRVAACHTSGRQGSRTVEVPCRAADDDTEESASLPVCTTPNTTVNRVTSTGSSIMTGSTAGGQVGPTALDGAVCEQSAVNSRINN
ncbi:hypothetical protein L0Y47_04430 [Ectopseudomonas composti]